MSSYTEGQIHQLANALERKGFTPDDITKLGQYDRLDEFRGVLNGTHEIVRKKHTVDLAKPPQLPFDGAEEVKHDGEGIVELELRSDDNLYVGGKKVVLHRSERQMGEKRIVGHELREELESGEQVLLNSNVADYLHQHPELFPEHWKKNEQGETLHIFFWGTVFRRPSRGDLFACCLYWDGGGLGRSSAWLDGAWGRLHPSASVAN